MEMGRSVTIAKGTDMRLMDVSRTNCGFLGVSSRIDDQIIIVAWISPRNRKSISHPRNNSKTSL
jgi:hypothetical protein